MPMRINKIEIQGFRAFGRKAQTLEFPSTIAVVWGPNSQGKTSLAEAFEFLLTGQIVRRELMSSTQDEFADALRNAHMPAGTPTFVQAEITSPDGTKHTIKRTLTADYGKKQDCQTSLLIDGAAAADSALRPLGIALSQPPLAAPVLAQHTLGYLFSARPQDRASYFKALLEVTDLESFRASVAGLEAMFKVPEEPAIAKLKLVAAIPETQAIFALLQLDVPTTAEIKQSFSEAARALITAAGEAAPDKLSERITKLEQILAEKRAKTFPVKAFDKQPLAPWSQPAAGEFGKLRSYVEERAKVDAEARRLMALFSEALALPAVAATAEAIDCPLCEAEKSLTPARVTFIRERVRDTASFRAAEKAAQDALAKMASNAESVIKAINDSLPLFIAHPSKFRRQRGFRIDRIKALLGPDAAPAIDTWLRALRRLARLRTVAIMAADHVRADVASCSADLETLMDPQALADSFDRIGEAFRAFELALRDYLPAEKVIADGVKAVVDAESKTSGWQELIDLARDLPGLRGALIEQAVREAGQKELAQALRQIDKANEAVLDEKFQDLSDGVQIWWDLLRPGELSFFSAVKPRPGARRTIDFKAGLSANLDRSDPKLRDVIAVFSQSQLHCLGLALFLARAVQEEMGFIVLDDPILSSDEDYRAYFATSVLEKLLELGVQLVVLTQDQKTFKDLGERYLHKKIDLFQIALQVPGDGTMVTNTADDLATMLTRAVILARGGHPDLRKQGGEILRNAGERFCKEVLVKDRRAKGDKAAAIVEYDGENLGKLCPKVEPLLTADPAHPGKLRAIGKALNPATHDDAVPDQGTLMVAHGDLQTLKKQYL